MNNNLKKFPAVGSSKKLRTINLNYNSLRGLEAIPAGCNFPATEELFLAGNLIDFREEAEFRAFLGKLKVAFGRLRKLSVAENPFMESGSVLADAGLDIGEEVKAHLKSLAVLDGEALDAPDQNE